MGAPDSVTLPTTLDPLPQVLHRGLIAVSFFGFLSLVASVFLFLLLTYRLFAWYRQGQLRDGANQFFVLVYNLLLADIQQALSFALTAVYVSQNKIEVGTGTCFAQAWLVSTGDLASSVFILFLALHTFFAIVRGRVLDSKVFYAWIAVSWVFVYAMAIATVAIDRKIYVRAGAWCWIDRKYERERLALHYIWILLAMGSTIIIYAIVYLSIVSKLRRSAKLSTTSQTTITTTSTQAEKAATERAAKYMIIYPVVYVVCTLPLAGGRMAAMTGVQIPYWYYCLSGAAITSCGWLDVLLYAVIRRVLVFNKSPPPKTYFGLNTFSWYHGSDFYGTTTTIEGPVTQSRRRRFWWVRQKMAMIGGEASMISRTRSVLRPSKRRSSDEDYFASPTEGVITTKTTVEVTTGMVPGYAGSETSVLEMEDKPSMKSPSSPRR